MRRITIARQKSKFVGCLIDFLCALDMRKEDFTQLRDNASALAEENDAEWKAIRHRNWMAFKAERISPISNGKSIFVAIDGQDHNLWIAAETSTGWIFSNQASIACGDSDVTFIIKTNYSFMKGTSLCYYSGLPKGRSSMVN